MKPKKTFTALFFMGERNVSVDVEEFLHSNLKVILFVVLYVLASSLAYYHIHSFISDPVCRCSIPMTWIVAMMSTTGVGVGVGVYIYMKKSLLPETVSPGELQETVRFLPPDEREIVEAVLGSSGVISQSELPEQTGLDRVKVSRKLKELERQGIVEREENGMTNTVSLAEPFEELLLDRE